MLARDGKHQRNGKEMKDKKQSPFVRTEILITLKSDGDALYHKCLDLINSGIYKLPFKFEGNLDIQSMGKNYDVNRVNCVLDGIAFFEE